MHPSASSTGAARLGRLVAHAAGVVLAAVALTVTSPVTAHAAQGALCSGQGVSLAVDFKDLGGGVVQACDESGGGKFASEVFQDAGFELTPVGAFPGAACQVDGQPADVGCAKMPPANAYWGLYVGRAGTWAYAPTGANELKLKDGDFVAFAWQSTSTSSPPDVAPVAAPSAAPSATPSAEAEASSAPVDDESEQDGGLAWWVPTLVVVVLAGAGVGLAVRRRGAAER